MIMIGRFPGSTAWSDSGPTRATVGRVEAEAFDGVLIAVTDVAGVEIRCQGRFGALGGGDEDLQTVGHGEFDRDEVVAAGHHEFQGSRGDDGSVVGDEVGERAGGGLAFTEEDEGLFLPRFLMHVEGEVGGELRPIAVAHGQEAGNDRELVGVLGLL
ncbi:hypothetical protein GCM10009690_09140 [Brevibacterium permense]|uniref:Uncharacterized protein n=2 Tax=Brevibacterium permense TaxID=234834 RepID=A0ABN2A187_9MICO